MVFDEEKKTLIFEHEGGEVNKWIIFLEFNYN